MKLLELLENWLNAFFQVQLFVSAALLPLACCHFPHAVHTFRPFLSPSTGFYWSHGEFLPMTAASPPLSGPQPTLSTFYWRTRTAICLNKLLPAARPGTSGKSIRATASGTFWLFKYIHINTSSTVFFLLFFFAAVPPCDSHRRSTETKIETSLRHTSGWRHWAPASLFFARRSAAGACQEMNSRLIQALNVLQMTTS